MWKIMNLTVWLLTLSPEDMYFLLKTQFQCVLPASGDGLQQCFPYCNSNILITHPLQATAIGKRALEFSSGGAWFNFLFDFLAEQLEALCYGSAVRAASRPERLWTGKMKEGSSLHHRCWLIACPFGHLCNGLPKKRLTVLGGKLEGPLCIQQCAAVATMDNHTDAFRLEKHLGQS